MAGDTLLAEETLQHGGSIACPTGQMRLEMQADGNLVLYRTDTNDDVWASETYRWPVAFARMQGDGNFVCYDATGTLAH
jgi:hypothetical protein